MHANWLWQQQIPIQQWCKWTSLKTSHVFIRVKFPVPIGKQTVSHCTLSWSGSRTKVYQQSFCQITTIMTLVVPYTVYVLKYIREHFGDNVHDIEIWTDGPSSQFKNKYIFAFIGIILPQLIAYKVFWNYLATNHGKGAVGVGGTIKQVATPAVVTRKAIIKDVVSMFNAVNERAKPSHTLLSWPRNTKSPHSEMLVCTSYGKTSAHYLAWCTFTMLSKQTKEKFLLACSTMINPALSIPWTQLSW